LAGTNLSMFMFSAVSEGKEQKMWMWRTKMRRGCGFCWPRKELYVWIDVWCMPDNCFIHSGALV